MGIRKSEEGNVDGERKTNGHLDKERQIDRKTIREITRRTEWIDGERRVFAQTESENDGV